MDQCPEIATSTEELKEILARISFVKSCIDFTWDWEVEELSYREAIQDLEINSVHYVTRIKGWLVNTTFRRPDIDTGEIGIGRGRQLFVPVGASKTNVFFTCWVAVELIIRHEAMEAIRFDGKRVLNPHHSLDELALPDVFKLLKLDPKNFGANIE